MRRTPLHPGAHPLEAKGGSRYPEHVDAPYRAYVRSLPCAVDAVAHDLTRTEIAEKGWWPCASRPERDRVEAAHLRTWSASGEDRGNLVPMCPVHHDEQEGKTKRFCDKYVIDLYQLAAEIQVEYEEQERAG